MALADYLTRFIPPPTYLQIPAVGIDVSDSSLKYLQLRSSMWGSANRKILHSGEFDISSPILDRGTVTDPDALAELLRAIREETGVRFARLSLPEERAYLFETEIDSDTSFQKIRNTLEFRLEENVPLSPRDAYFDYETYQLPYKPEMVGVSVTAYARETVDGYVEACRKAGVTPLSLEVEAEAIRRAVLPECDLGTHLIVDMGKTRTGVGIVHAGVLMYTSTIDIGGNEFSSALRSVLGDIPEDDCTTYKNETGLIAEGEGEEEDATNALTESVEAVLQELNRRIHYWNNREEMNEDQYIESVVLCGGSANMRGLPEYLTKALDIETVRADVWQNVFPAGVPESVPIDRAHSYGFATTIGLALNGVV